MPMLSPGPLLALLLVGPLAAAAPLPPCSATVRVDVPAESPSELPVVCLRPGQDTTFRLDATLAQEKEAVRIEGVGPAVRTQRGEQEFTLSLADDFPTGGRYRLTVLFAEPEAPESFSLWLVVHPEEVTRQVRVYRHARSASESLGEGKDARAAAEQCAEEKRQLEASCRSEASLARVLAASAEPPEFASVIARQLTGELSRGNRNALHVEKVRTYHLGATYALAVQLTNSGARPWLAPHAALRNENGKPVPLLPVVQRAAIEPGTSGWVLVEVGDGGATPNEPHSLTLWDVDGTRALVVGNLTFP